MRRSAALEGPRRRWPDLLRFTLGPLIAFLVVLDAVNGGGSPAAVRSVAAVLVWWGLLVAIAFSLGPRAPVPRVAIACAALLLLFALLTGLSTGWSPSAERAFAELDRVLLYVGVLLLPVVFARPGDAGRWADGLAGAAAIVALLAVGQRLFPGIFPADHLADVLPNAATRLSYPLGYWNGLAIFVALGLPLLLRSAVNARAPLIRAAAVAPIPLLAATMYLSSSRGGVAVAVVAALVFVVLSGSVRALGALLAGAVGSAGAIAVLAARPVLVDGPFAASKAESTGVEAALLIAGICVVCALAYVAFTAAVGERLRVPLVVWIVLAVVGAGAVIAAHPAARVREFKAPPPAQSVPGAVAVDTHLSSGSGSGRWQFWSAALDEFSANPIAGGGAGSFEPYWAQHGTLDWFVRNAHSLWLESLAELGLIGLLLVAGPFAIGLASGLSRLRRVTGPDRTTIAALVAVLAGFGLGAALDWIWQLPAVAALALLSLGLLVGPATAAPRPADRPPRLRFAVRAAIVLGAWVVLCAQAIPFLADQEVGASQRAARGGDLRRAIERAQSAVAIQPWASSPRLQLALAREEAGQIGPARHDLGAAIARDNQDWRLQVVGARLAVKAGDIRAGRQYLARARSLNPRSRLLRSP
ncbi:MAG TPA: O-antigen ligase family protein [Thermoleophilaceae bacterium]